MSEIIDKMESVGYKALGSIHSPMFYSIFYRENSPTLMEITDPDLYNAKFKKFLMIDIEEQEAFYNILKLKFEKAPITEKKIRIDEFKNNMTKTEKEIYENIIFPDEKRRSEFDIQILQNKPFDDIIFEMYLMDKVKDFVYNRKLKEEREKCLFEE